MVQAWTAVSNGLPNKSPVKALAVSGTNLFAGTLTVAFFFRPTTAQAGVKSIRAWQTLYVNALAISGTNLFAGTVHGVFLSTNSGTSWGAVDTGLTNPYVYALAISGTNLFAGSGGRGVWRRPLSEMITTDYHIESGLPHDFILSQNYPNPFNPITTIKYELPKESLVRLNVYDMLGHEVSVLVNERMDAGVHEAKFDAVRLSSGMYVYRLRAGDYVSTKRMILMK